MCVLFHMCHCVCCVVVQCWAVNPPRHSSMLSCSTPLLGALASRMVCCGLATCRCTAASGTSRIRAMASRDGPLNVVPAIAMRLHKPVPGARVVRAQHDDHRRCRCCRLVRHCSTVKVKHCSASHLKPLCGPTYNAIVRCTCAPVYLCTCVLVSLCTCVPVRPCACLCVASTCCTRIS